MGQRGLERFSRLALSEKRFSWLWSQPDFAWKKNAAERLPRTTKLWRGRSYLRCSGCTIGEFISDISAASTFCSLLDIFQELNKSNFDFHPTVSKLWWKSHWWACWKLQAFDLFDTDQSGEIDLKELKVWGLAKCWGITVTVDLKEFERLVLYGVVIHLRSIIPKWGLILIGYWKLYMNLSWEICSRLGFEQTRRNLIPQIFKLSGMSGSHAILGLREQERHVMPADLAPMAQDLHIQTY